jgi:hypothetical protein
MSSAGLVLSLVVIVLTAGVLVLPLIRARRAAASPSDLLHQQQREQLLNAYERVLFAIRELDEDFHTGKLSEEVYTSERAVWSEQGVTLLQSLERLNGKSAGRMPDAQRMAERGSQIDQELDDAVEQVIANYVKSRRGSGAGR